MIEGVTFFDGTGVLVKIHYVRFILIAGVAWRATLRLRPDNVTFDERTVMPMLALLFTSGIQQRLERG